MDSMSTLVPSSADTRMVKCATCGTKLRTPDEQIPVAVWGIANQRVIVVKCRACVPGVRAGQNASGGALTCRKR